MPLYAAPEQQAQVAAIARWRTEGSGPCDRAEFTADLAASGVDPAMIERAWQIMLDGIEAVDAAIAARSYHAAGGGLFYIVAGQVPDRTIR